MAEPETSPEIVPEATAKRRLLIYTLVRLVGLVAIGVGYAIVGAGLWAVSDGKVGGWLLIVLGVASLFIRPKLLSKLLGARW